MKGNPAAGAGEEGAGKVLTRLMNSLLLVAARAVCAGRRASRGIPEHALHRFHAPRSSSRWMQFGSTAGASVHASVSHACVGRVAGTATLLREQPSIETWKFVAPRPDGALKDEVTGVHRRHL